MARSTTDGTALMLPGGGARGAYQIGALRAVTELSDHPDRPFSILVGTSAGAVNAAVLASHLGDFRHGIDRLAYFWESMHCARIYRTDWPCVLKSALHWMGALLFGRLGLPPPHSLLDTEPLRRLLEEETDLDGIERALQRGDLTAVAITASAYTSSQAISFVQSRDAGQSWRAGRRVGRQEAIRVDHIMASAALPILFPPVRIRQEYYGDGGLRQTAPLSPAIHLGAERILVITTRDEHPDPEPSSTVAMPSFGDVAGYMLDIVFMDNLQADLDRLNRINQTLKLMTEEQQRQSALRPVETLVLRPSTDVRDIADRYMDRMPASVEVLLASLGAWRRGTRLPSYLLFEAEYCKELMEMGYRDAMAQQDEIRQLLNGE